MGKIYDDKALERINGWLDAQEQSFIDVEKEKNLKQWFVLGSISIVAGIALLLIVKKMTK